MRERFLAAVAAASRTAGGRFCGRRSCGRLPGYLPAGGGFPDARLRRLPRTRAGRFPAGGLAARRSGAGGFPAAALAPGHRPGPCAGLPLRGGHLLAPTLPPGARLLFRLGHIVSVSREAAWPEPGGSRPGAGCPV